MILAKVVEEEIAPAGNAEENGAILELLPVGLAIVGFEGTIAYVNAEFARLFGADKGALTGAYIDTLLPKAAREKHAAERKAYARSPRDLNMGTGREVRARRVDGREFPAQVALRPIRYKARAAVLATVVDITEQLAATDAFRKVFESAPNGFVLVGDDGKIQQTNARLDAMFGYASEDLIGQEIEILVPHRLREGHAPLRTGFSAAPTARAMGEGRDLTGRRKDGVEIPIEIGLSGFSTLRGPVSCASVVDITERKRSELKLREANAQLEEFANVAAHDLRSPMRGIVNLIDFVEDDFGADAPRSALKNLQRMRERALGVERLIDDLLTYARAGRRSTKFEPVDLAGIIDEILASHLFPEGLRIERDLAAEAFEGARTPLATVLRNLIGNAIKHHDRQEMHIAVKSRDEGDFVAIDVVDDGPGIPEAAQERVFRLFQTLSKSDQKGSGLGLAVAQRLVSGHGGRLNVTSADGRRGCVFRIHWPRIVRSDLDE